MNHVVLGVIVIVIGAVVVGLQPALKRSWTRNGDIRTGVRTYGNVITGIVIVVVGILVAVAVI